MLTNNKNLTEIFETERWLYVDGSLDNERKIFWDNLIKNNDGLKILLADAQKFSTDFNEITEVDLESDKFNSIIDNILEHPNRNPFNSFISRIFPNEKKDTSPRSLKLAFAGSILIIIIAALFSLQYPSQKSKVDSKLLTWDDSSFNRELNEAKFEFADITDERVSKYFQYQLANDKWLREVVSIQREISKLSAAANNKSL